MPTEVIENYKNNRVVAMTIMRQNFMLTLRDESFPRLRQFFREPRI